MQLGCGDWLVAGAILCTLVTAGCGGTEPESPKHDRSGGLRPCVDAWNQPANFAPGRPGRLIRRLGPTPSVPLFAHISRDARKHCVVFLDTPSTLGDRRFIRSGGRFVLDCAGDCGQQVPTGARTFQFLPDGSLPAVG